MDTPKNPSGRGFCRPVNGSRSVAEEHSAGEAYVLVVGVGGISAAVPRMDSDQPAYAPSSTRPSKRLDAAATRSPPCITTTHCYAKKLDHRGQLAALDADRSHA